MQFTENQIKEMCLNSLGQPPVILKPISFDFTATALTIATEKAKYWNATKQALFGNFIFTPYVSSASAIDFTARLKGKTTYVFDMTFKDSTNTDKFSMLNELNQKLITDIDLVENAGYTNGGLFFQFVGYRVEYGL